MVLERVKFFEIGYSINNLEEDINEWLKKTTNIQIVDIKLTEAEIRGSTDVNVMVIYRKAKHIEVK